MTFANERRLETYPVGINAPEGAQKFHPQGAAGLLAEGRNMPIRNDSQLLAGMPSNQALMDRMGFQMQQLQNRMQVDFPAEKNAFSTGKQLAAGIRAAHKDDNELVQLSLSQDMQQHGVRNIFVHGYREGKQNAYYELGNFNTIQSKLNEMSGGRGQLLQNPGDSRTLAANQPSEAMTNNKYSDRQQPKAEPMSVNVSDMSSLTTRGALLMGDMANKPKAALSVEQYGRMPKMAEKQSTEQQRDGHKAENKQVDLTRNQYDALNARHRDGSEQHIFNSYISALAGSLTDRSKQTDRHETISLAHARPGGAEGDRIDQAHTNKRFLTPDQLKNQSRNLDVNERAARDRDLVERTEQLAAERKNTKVVEDRNDRIHGKQAREEVSRNNTNANGNEQGNERHLQVVHDPSESQSHERSLPDSFRCALEDLSALLTQLGGDNNKEKSKLIPILKLKMLMKLRMQVMMKFRLQWGKAKAKLEKLKLKMGAKAKLKVLTTRRQNNQRRADVTRTERQRTETRRRRRRSEQADRQRREAQPGENRRNEAARSEAQRAVPRRVESNIASLDAARALRRTPTTRSDAPPQHHVTEVSCVAKVARILKQSLFGPMNCGRPEGVATIPQLTDASFGASTSVTTTALRA